METILNNLYDSRIHKFNLNRVCFNNLKYVCDIILYLSCDTYYINIPFINIVDPLKESLISTLQEKQHLIICQQPGYKLIENNKEAFIKCVNSLQIL